MSATRADTLSLDRRPVEALTPNCPRYPGIEIDSNTKGTKPTKAGPDHWILQTKTSFIQRMIGAGYPVFQGRWLQFPVDWDYG